MKTPRGLAPALLFLGFGGGLWFAWRGTLPEAPRRVASVQESTRDSIAPEEMSGVTDPDLPVAGDANHPGREVYVTYCASCHGMRGEGQPDWKIPLEDGSLPAPPHDPSGHTWHHADAELLRIVREGGVIYMPESNMPGYAAVLDEAEIRAVLGYIKTLWGPREVDFQEEVSRNWVGVKDSGDQR